MGPSFAQSLLNSEQLTPTASEPISGNETLALFLLNTSRSAPGTVGGLIHVVSGTWHWIGLPREDRTDWNQQVLPDVAEVRPGADLTETFVVEVGIAFATGRASRLENLLAMAGHLSGGSLTVFTVDRRAIDQLVGRLLGPLAGSLS